MEETVVLTVTKLVGHAMELARKAGALQLKYFRSGQLDISTKSGEADIVTRVDKESERMIIDGILGEYPSHGLLAEESGERDSEVEWSWVIDPLDGTTNYASGIPFFAVSIGICYNGETLGAVVYLPVFDEMFSAVRGLGASLNGDPIHVLQNDRLDRAVVSTGFPVDKDVNPDNNLDNVSRVLPRVRGLRRLGAAAADMCYVAAGILDAYWELNLHEWDVNAASLIVEEAGGRVHHFRENRNVSVLVSSDAIYNELKPLIK